MADQRAEVPPAEGTMRLPERTARVPVTALEALADALRTWQRWLGNQLMTTYYIDKAEEPAQLMLDALLRLPVEQRMEAMGMRKVTPFGMNGHGLGCAFRRGHECDCTTANATYWTAASRGAESSIVRSPETGVRGPE